MIILKSAKELERMRKAGRIVYETHQMLKEAIRPGVTTRELDRLAEKFIRKHGATPSFKGYNGFKGSICASVNEELVHGIPGDRVLQDGDLISLISELAWMVITGIQPGPIPSGIFPKRRPVFWK